MEKDQKISCRVLQSRKEGSASELHDDLENFPFPKSVVKKLLGTGKAAMVMEFQGALQLLSALSVDVNVWLAYSRRSGGGCPGKGRTAENHGRSSRVIQERPVHRQEPKSRLLLPSSGVSSAMLAVAPRRPKDTDPPNIQGFAFGAHIALTFPTRSPWTASEPTIWPVATA